MCDTCHQYIARVLSTHIHNRCVNHLGPHVRNLSAGEGESGIRPGPSTGDMGPFLGTGAMCV